jgi:hypothetical protein
MTMMIGLGPVKAALAALAIGAALCTSAAAATLTYQAMALKNGWQRYSNAVAAPGAALDSENVVHLRGAMFQTGPANQAPFILHVKFRPNRTLFVPITLINGRPGRIAIFASGSVLIEAGNSFDDARGFTSLEGVVFSKN